MAARRRARRPPAPVPAATRAALQEVMQGNVPQLLFKAARLVNETAIARVNAESGAFVLRAAHTTLLPHLDFQGVRITAVAARLGVTKQFVSQLVAELAEEGFVEQIPDPSDGRAKLVRLSRRGAQAMSHGLGVLRGIEQELTAILGAERMTALADDLTGIIRHVQDRSGTSIEGDRE